MKSADTHGVGLEQLLDDVTVRVVEVAEEIGPSQRCQVAYAVDEELRVGNAAFLFEFTLKTSLQVQFRNFEKVVLHARLSNDVDGGVEPHLFSLAELDPFLIDRDPIRFGCEVSLTRVCVSVNSVVDNLSGTAAAEPLQQVSNLR